MSEHEPGEQETKIAAKQKDEEPELPLPWKRIQGGIWLLGIAILAYTGWWWPGILVLVAVSGLAQGGIQLYLGRQKKEETQIQESKKIEQQRAGWLPSLCPNCGGPISVKTVRWTGPDTADCPYCNANIKRPA
jgi:hypothetical protein